MERRRLLLHLKMASCAYICSSACFQISMRMGQKTTVSKFGDWKADTE